MQSGFDLVKQLQEKQQKAKEKSENKPIENSIENDEIHSDYKGEKNNHIENKKEKIIIDINMKMKDEKQVKSYYFKKSTIRNIKNHAKLLGMKDSEFIEVLLEQYFASQISK
jgi:hypothetical protein